MDVKQTVTVTLTEGEARDYCAEVAEINQLQGSGNTRTGFAVVRRIAGEFTARGMGAPR
jgi:hypothetical protein